MLRAGNCNGECHKRTCRLLAYVPTAGQRSSPLASAPLAAASSKVCSCSRMGQICSHVQICQGGPCSTQSLGLQQDGPDLQ